MQSGACHHGEARSQARLFGWLRLARNLTENCYRDAHMRRNASDGTELAYRRTDEQPSGFIGQGIDWHCIGMKKPKPSIEQSPKERTRTSSEIQ